jgi:hypothetical protein
MIIFTDAHSRCVGENGKQLWSVSGLKLGICLNGLGPWLSRNLNREAWLTSQSLKSSAFDIYQTPYG